ncbi:MAG: dihydrodipicolinate synthase family protein [Clostridiales bacterium]|jgi:N-acetylneuraminate lyase|nr:dihydrodipicolinate synthase family protein [Clostridiales bacterium]
MDGKKSNALFSGIMSALVSPLSEDGEVRERPLRRLVEWHLEAGLSGFYICGGTGEGAVMQPKARKLLAECVVDAARGRCRIIDHIGAVDLITAKDLARHAARAGVDALSSVPPFFYPYGEDEVFNYYEALSDCTDLPIIMYASPMSGAPPDAEAVERLMRIPGIAGIKWTSHNYYEMRRIKDINGGDINVINGPDETLVCGLLMGADAGIGSSYNVMPRLFAKLYEDFRAGRLQEALDAQLKANKVIRLLFRHGIVNSVKDMLELIGYDVGYCTYPLKRLEPAEREAFHAELRETGWPEGYI